MACGADNLQAKMAIKDGTGAVDFASGATALEFTSESVKSTGSLLRSEGIRGTRAVEVSQSRRGAYTVAGSVNFDASPTAILEWGRRALGANSSGVLTPAESLPTFSLLIDKVSGIHRFQDCKVGKLTLSAGGPGIVTGVAEIVGRGHTGTGLTFPSLTLGSDAIDAPLVFSDLVAELAAATYEFGSFSLVIDNTIQTITRNALYAGCNREGRRVITLAANVPSNSSTFAALDEPTLAGIAAELSLTSTLAAVGVTIELPACQKARDLPVVNGPGEQTWDVSLQAVKDGSTDEITITVDTTE